MAYVAMLFLLVIFFTLSLTFLLIAGTDLAATATRGDNLQVEYLAESAVAHAKWRLLHDDTFPDQDDIYYMHSLGSGRYGYKVRRHTPTTFATVATVGVMGANVTQQSYVLYVLPPLNPIKVLIVINQSSPNAQELLRIDLMESWGYEVTTIGAKASQANFNAKLAVADVAYVCLTLKASDTNTKLNRAVIGVVNENINLSNYLDISNTAPRLMTRASIRIDDNKHYITQPFALGRIRFCSSLQPVTGIENNRTAPGMQILGETQYGGKIDDTRPSLGAVEAGATGWSGAPLKGRRAQLPWGDNGFDFAALNDTGRTIMKRAIEWGANIDAGLVAHWKLDESSGTVAADSSANNNNGTLVNMTPATDWVAAKVDGGLDFDGSNDYVTVPNSASLQLKPPLSLAGWIKADAFGSSMDVDIIVRKGEDNPNNWQLMIANRRIMLSLDGNDNGGISGITLLNTGTWYHVAATWDGATVRIYLNGVLDNIPAARAGTIGTDPRAVYVGGSAGTDLTNGILDDVRVYRRALRATDIQHLYTMGN